MKPATPAPDEASPAPASPRWAIDGVNRTLGGLGLLGLAVITGIISYQHGLEVARAAGAHGIVAYLVPLVADLMIATSSLSILDAARNGGTAPLFAWIGLVVGVVVTVVMNVAAGWSGGWGPRLLNAVAPVALILSYEALMEMIRRHRNSGENDDDPSQPDATVNQCPHAPAMSAEDAAVVAYFHIKDCVGGKPSQRQLAASFDVSRTTLSQRIKDIEATPEPEQRREPVVASAGAGS